MEMISKLQIFDGFISVLIQRNSFMGYYISKIYMHSLIEKLRFSYHFPYNLNTLLVVFFFFIVSMLKYQI